MPMVAAYKKHMHIKESTNIEAILDEQSGEIGVFSTKLVVNEVEDPGKPRFLYLKQKKLMKMLKSMMKLKLKLLLNNSAELLPSLQNR